MKKRIILIPLAFLTGIAGIMKLIWDSLSDTPQSKQPYDLLQNRVQSILKRKSDNKNFGAADLLDELEISRDIVESTFGEPIENVILNYRLELAEKLLRTTDDTISCISETVGFGESSALYRPFKEKNGMEPSQYREKFRS